jgi:Fe-S cluster biogenesis protein NfuA
MTTSSTDEITEALAGFAGALRADGYALEVDEVSDTLSLRIVALDGACEDCLVPAAIMAPTISASLGRRYAPEQIRLTYPEGYDHI